MMLMMKLDDDGVVFLVITVTLQGMKLIALAQADWNE